MPIKLICEFARPNEQTFTQPVIKVGTLSSSHFRIEHAEVSRMHAVIEKNDDGYYIIDLGSHSGTKINKKKVNKARIENASVIELGKVVVHAYIDAVGAEAGPNPLLDTSISVRNALQVLVDSKNKMEREVVIGQAGGGLVMVEFDGAFRPRDVFVDPLAMEDAKMVQDLVKAALVDAHEKFQELAERIAQEAVKRG